MVYPKILETIKANRKNKENVYVVGHSLGGAMAVLVAEALTNDGIPVKELRTSWATQELEIDSSQSEGCDIGAYIHVNNNDIVPKMHPIHICTWR